MAVTHNKFNGSVLLHDTANATYTIAGNNSVSNVATQTEILTGAGIAQVWYGANNDTTSWTIKRGANVVAVYHGTGHANYSGHGQILDLFPTGTVVLEKTGGVGYIMVELKKQGTKQST